MLIVLHSPLRYIEVSGNEKTSDITQKQLAEELDVQNADKVSRFVLCLFGREVGLPTLPRRSSTSNSTWGRTTLPIVAMVVTSCLEDAKAISL